MQLDELTPVLPERDWDELITASMRRGRTLRRRRRALAASPMAALLAVIVAIPLSGVFEPNHDGLARLHTTNVGPAHTVDGGPAPEGTSSPDPVQQVIPGPGTLPVLPGPGGAHPARRVGPQQSGPGVIASATSAAHAAVRAVTLTYDDPQGDATPQDAAPGGPAAPAPSAASDPTLDITRMAFTADGAALHITMTLLGNYRTDAYYMAAFTDTRNKCTYTVLLGGGYHDQVWWACPSDSGADFLQGAPDSPHGLNANLTLSALHGGVRAQDSLTSLTAQTRLVHPAGGQWPYDSAATSKTLRLP